MSNLINYEFETIYGILQEISKNNDPRQRCNIYNMSYSVKEEAIKNVGGTDERRFCKFIKNFETKNTHNENYNVILHKDNLYKPSFKFKALPLDTEVYFINNGILEKGIIIDILFTIYYDYQYRNITEKEVQTKIIYIIKNKAFNNVKYIKKEILEKDIFLDKKIGLSSLKQIIDNITIKENEIKEEKRENICINSPYGIGQKILITDEGYTPFESKINKLYYSYKKNKFDFAEMNFRYGNQQWTLNRKRTLERKNRTIQVIEESPLFEQFFNLNIYSLNQNMYFYHENNLYSGNIVDVIISINYNPDTKNLIVEKLYKVMSKQRRQGLYIKEEDMSFKKDEPTIFMNRIIAHIEK